MLPFIRNPIYKTNLWSTKLNCCLCIHQRYTKEKKFPRCEKINRNLMVQKSTLPTNKVYIFIQIYQNKFKEKCIKIKFEIRKPPWTPPQQLNLQTPSFYSMVYMFDFLTSIRILEIWVRHIWCWRNWFLKLEIKKNLVK